MQVIWSDQSAPKWAHGRGHPKVTPGNLLANCPNYSPWHWLVLPQCSEIACGIELLQVHLYLSRLIPCFKNHGCVLQPYSALSDVSHYNVGKDTSCCNIRAKHQERAHSHTKKNAHVGYLICNGCRAPGVWKLSPTLHCGEALGARCAPGPSQE